MADILHSSSSVEAGNVTAPKVLPDWIKAYADSNKDFPMAPAYTDTHTGNAVIQAIILGRSSIAEFAASELNPAQRNGLMSVATSEHLKRQIEVVSKAHLRGASVHNPTYLKEDVFDGVWLDMKTRILRAMEIFALNADSGLRLNPNDPLEGSNISAMTEFFTSSKYELQRDALCNLYAAADAALGTPEVIELGKKQDELNLPSQYKGFRVTEPLTELISTIDASVTGEWEKRYKKTIPKVAVVSFTDVITRRQDQPVV